MMGKDDDGERKKRERGVKNVKGRGGQAEMMKCNKERGKERQTFLKSQDGEKNKRGKEEREKEGGGKGGVERTGRRMKGETEVTEREKRVEERD